MKEDKNLNRFFNTAELQLIKEAIEDHRASKNRRTKKYIWKDISIS